MMAATDTHNNEDYIDTATAATAEKRNNDKIGQECKRWWWQWKPKGDLFVSTQYRNLIYRVLGV